MNEVLFFVERPCYYGAHGYFACGTSFKFSDKSRSLTKKLANLFDVLLLLRRYRHEGLVFIDARGT